MDKHAYIDGYMYKEAAQPWNMTNSLREAFRRPAKLPPERTRADRQGVVGNAGKGVGTMPWTKEYGGSFNDPVPKPYRDQVQQERAHLDRTLGAKNPRQYAALNSGQRPVRDMVAPGEQMPPSGRRDPIRPDQAGYQQEMARLRNAPSKIQETMTQNAKLKGQPQDMAAQYEALNQQFHRKQREYKQQLLAALKANKIDTATANGLWRKKINELKSSDQFKAVDQWARANRAEATATATYSPKR